MLSESSRGAREEITAWLVALGYAMGLGFMAVGQARQQTFRRLLPHGTATPPRNDQIHYLVHSLQTMQRHSLDSKKRQVTAGSGHAERAAPRSVYPRQMISQLPSFQRPSQALVSMRTRNSLPGKSISITSLMKFPVGSYIFARAFLRSRL